MNQSRQILILCVTLMAGLVAAETARVGLDALAHNRRDVVMGLGNKIMSFGTRLAPISLQLALSERYMSGRT